MSGKITKLNNDSYSNTMSGLGNVKRDKNKHTQIDYSSIIEDDILDMMYIGDGLATSIVDIVADDSTRNGWTYLNDEEQKIDKELKRVKFKQAVNKAKKYARLYRGAIIVMITENGTLDKPIMNSSGAIKQLRVYSAARIQDMQIDIVIDPQSKYFEDVEYFNVRLLSGDTTKIHRGRCLVFKGEMVPDNAVSTVDFKNRYWGLSSLQRVEQRLKYFGATEQGVANLMQELGLSVMSLSNMKQILAMNKEEALSKIFTRIEAINASKSTINSILMDKDETFTRIDTKLQGVPEVMNKMETAVCAVSKIPVTKLFGTSPGGLNATGFSDMNNYYNMIESEQEDDQPEMEVCIKYVGSYVYGGNKDDYGIDEFKPLWSPTEKEKAETGKLNAETNGMYIDRGVVTSEDVQKKEFPELTDEHATRKKEEDDEMEKALELENSNEDSNESKKKKHFWNRDK